MVGMQFVLLRCILSLATCEGVGSTSYHRVIGPARKSSIERLKIYNFGSLALAGVRTWMFFIVEIYLAELSKLSHIKFY